MIQLLFSRKHILKTLLIVFLCALFMRLAIWQLNRRVWRQEQNATLLAQLEQPPFRLNDIAPTDWATLPEQKDRAAFADGAFDDEWQILLLNQNNDIGSGVHLITPFVLEGTEQAILVDRGWIGLSEWEAADWSLYEDKSAVVTGRIALEQPPPPNVTRPVEFTGAPPELFRLNTDHIGAKVPYELLPIVLVQTPEDSETIATRPFRAEPQHDLSGGPHLSYAIQWVAFTLIFSVGYLGYLRKYPD